MKQYTCTLPFSKKEKEMLRQKKSMVGYWGDWLNTMDWDYYCTFTTRYSLSMNGARNSMPRLKDFLANKYGLNTTIFWVAEPFDSKYGYHLHALLKAHSEPSTKLIDDIKVAWQIVSRGKFGKENKFTVIVPYDKNLGGNYYVAKSLHRYNADCDFI